MNSKWRNVVDEENMFTFTGKLRKNSYNDDKIPGRVFNLRLSGCNTFKMSATLFKSKQL